MNTQKKTLKDALASTLKRFVIWLKCLLVGHDWLYAEEKPINGKRNRECRRCAKRQRGTYDMMYGTTNWTDGW